MKARMDRREVLGLGAWAAGAVTLTACGGGPPDAPGEGDAYAPWQYPDAGLPPHLRVVHAALLAASPHNTQPWIFVAAPDRVDVLVDRSRHLGAMDPLAREMMIGVGCALENLLLAARAEGLDPALTLFPDGTQAERVARVDFRPGSAAQQDPLHDAIPRRHTHRGMWKGSPLEAHIIDGISPVVADLTDVQLHLLTAESPKAAFRDHTVDATRAIVEDQEMLAASEAWFRHRPHDVESHRDGVTLHAQSMDPVLTALAIAAPRMPAKLSGASWLDVTRTRHTVRVSSFAVLTTPDLTDPAGLVAVGRAYQRVHLWLTTQGLAVQPLNQLAEMRDREMQRGAPGTHTQRLEALCPQGQQAQMLFRLGYAEDSGRPSPRRPVSWVVRAPA
jgi:hypothetical protein